VDTEKKSYIINRRRLCPALSGSMVSRSLTSSHPGVKQMDMHVEPSSSRVLQIFSMFQKLSDGCDGGVSGFGGSVQPSGLSKILEVLQVAGKRFLDLGAGDGCVLLAAAKVFHASHVCGVELPENDGTLKVVFDATLDKMWPQTNAHRKSVVWISADINKLEVIPGNAQCVYSFWVGMPLNTQENILDLCRKSGSVSVLVIFRDHKWPSPHAVLERLNDNAGAASDQSQHFIHSDTFSVSMRVSSESKTVWSFRRQ
jgi:SAM-dependent methyltransferase